MKRHEIQVLKRSGLSNRKIAELAGVSVRTIQRIAKDPPVEDPQAVRPRLGRRSAVHRFQEFVREVLSGEPNLPTVEVLHRARVEGYRGGKSAFYSLVAGLRPRSLKPMVRFEGLPGEFSQHDFGCVDVAYGCGARARLHFFASRLKYSRWVYVEIVSDERVESLVRALLASFESFGGVPLVAVFDNPKTIVLSRDRSKIEWNSTFAQVALDYRFAPELCAPRRANQKGAVENLVGWVKGSFFKVRRFHDREDLFGQLGEWLLEVNTERPSRATGIIPRERLEEEAERLRPLAIPPTRYPLRFPIMVGPTGVVVHDKISYSMPPRSIGFGGTLFLYPQTVRIVAGRYEAEHPRYPASGRSSFLSEHRADTLASVSGERARLYYKRQQLLELGEDAERLLTEIVHCHPRTWRGEVEILFDLLQSHGDEALKGALRRAVTLKLFEAHAVARVLEGLAPAPATRRRTIIDMKKRRRTQ